MEFLPSKIINISSAFYASGLLVLTALLQDGSLWRSDLEFGNRTPIWECIYQPKNN